MCRIGVFLLISFHCPAYILGYLTVFVIIQELCLLKLRGIIFDSRNGQHFSMALGDPEGSRTWPGCVCSHFTAGQAGRDRPTGSKTPCAQSLWMFSCHGNELREKLFHWVLLLLQLLDPNSLTLPFPSQPLYSSQAPPTCLIFGF